MQMNLKYTHFNDRFRERFGQEFTFQDKRRILSLLKEKKYKKVYVEGDRLKVRMMYLRMEMILVIYRSTGDFITCYPPYKFNCENKGVVHGE